jgi:malonate transporter MadL subunit
MLGDLFARLVFSKPKPLMAIYGTALLSICLICGLILGKLFGLAMGIDANVGGVGIAMLLLILASGWLQARGRMPVPTQSGILFWSSIYIPIVVAMAASQNVRAAITGGPAAILAGTAAVVASFAMVPMISRLGQPPPAESIDAPSRSRDS